MKETAEVAKRARETGVLVPLEEAGLIRVAGDDRTVWLNGMISNDVARLEPGRTRSGCPALLLTNRGAIIAELHVLDRGDAYWLLLERSVVATTIETLGRFIVADDVTLVDESEAHTQWSVEGPAGAALFEALGVDPRLGPDAGADVEIAGHPVVLVARGRSGEWARQLIAPATAAPAVGTALSSAAERVGVEPAGPEVLEILRVEAGVPRQGFELSDDVLPAEARLDRAVSHTKGCYVGQEIVARLRSRGQVNHLMVGLRFEGPPPSLETPLSSAGKRTGEVTSVATSPAAGAIGLGFVRREHSEPGTTVDFEGGRAEVVGLPIVPATSASGAREDPGA